MSHAGGDNRLYSFLPLQPQNSGTYLVVSIGDDAAFAGVANIRDRSLVVLLGVILIAALMVRASSRMITDPVRNLVRTSRAVFPTSASSPQPLMSWQIQSNSVLTNSVKSSLAAAAPFDCGKVMPRWRTSPILRLMTCKRVQAFDTRLQDKYNHTLGEKGVNYLNRMRSATSDTDKSGTINSYQICVEDNNIGFEEKYTEHIFNLFEWLHGCRVKILCNPACPSG